MPQELLCLEGVTEAEAQKYISEKKLSRFRIEVRTIVVEDTTCRVVSSLQFFEQHPFKGELGKSTTQPVLEFLSLWVCVNC